MAEKLDRALLNPMISVQDLHKTYSIGEGALPALKGISLTVEQGEFVAIMGSSGSGKSTLLNILGCLDRPTSGTYLLDGADVSHMARDELAKVRNRKIGFIFQNFNLLSRTSAIENVELPLLYSSISSRESRGRAEEALARVGLDHRKGHYSSQLSGGEQQRVAIARALVNRPVLLLADEPTGNLDSRTGLDVMEILKGLNKEMGLTIVLVTHEVEVARYAERVIHIKDGQIDSIGVGV